MAPLESNFGVHSAREIPVPIPNTEVKPCSGDYTALRETSKMPNYTKKPPQRVAFRLSRRSLGKRKATRGVEETSFLDCEAIASSYNSQAPQTGCIIHNHQSCRRAVFLMPAILVTQKTI